MAIKVGDTLPPDVKLKEMKDGAPKDVTLGELFKGKRVVLFAVPGAFTPTCSMKHLPGFVSDADKIRAKGVDDIVCVSVNDVFVMDAWGKSSAPRARCACWRTATASSRVPWASSWTPVGSAWASARNAMAWW